MDHHTHRPPPAAAAVQHTAAASRFTRRPALVLFGLSLVAIGTGFRYMAGTMRKNEQAQKTSTDGYYVSVDRSGGGV